MVVIPSEARDLGLLRNETVLGEAVPSPNGPDPSLRSGWPSATSNQQPAT